jgi:hypothetical protein
MPDVGDAHWTFVDLPDGHAWEVWRQGSTLRDADRDLFGQVRATMQGYVATDRAGSVLGPFATLDEAAYPLALSGPTTARRLALQRGSAAPRGRNPVVLALAIGVAVRALLGVVRRNG